MKQIIIKNKKVKCITEIPYSQEIIKKMKKAGYKVKNEE